MTTAAAWDTCTAANRKAAREYRAVPIAACLLDGCHNLSRSDPGCCCTDHIYALRKAAG